MPARAFGGGEKGCAGGEDGESEQCVHREILLAVGQWPPLAPVRLFEKSPAAVNENLRREERPRGARDASAGAEARRRDRAGRRVDVEVVDLDVNLGSRGGNLTPRRIAPHRTRALAVDVERGIRTARDAGGRHERNAGARERHRERRERNGRHARGRSSPAPSTLRDVPRPGYRCPLRVFERPGIGVRLAPESVFDMTRCTQSRLTCL